MFQHKADTTHTEYTTHISKRSSERHLVSGSAWRRYQRSESVVPHWCFWPGLVWVRNRGPITPTAAELFKATYWSREMARERQQTVNIHPKQGPVSATVSLRLIREAIRNFGVVLFSTLRMAFCCSGVEWRSQKRNKKLIMERPPVNRESYCKLLPAIIW